MVNPNSDQQTASAMPVTTPVTSTGNDLSQKLLLLIRNAGAPEMVKDSLIAEVEGKGPIPEVMDKIIQSFQTEKDILNLTINSIENLKKQSGGQQALVAAPAPTVTTPVSMTPQQVAPQMESPIPPPIAAPEPIVENPVPENPVPESTLPVLPPPPAPVTTQTEPQKVADSDQELTNLLDELKQIQGQQGDQANPAPAV